MQTTQKKSVCCSFKLAGSDIFVSLYRSLIFSYIHSQYIYHTLDAKYFSLQKKKPSSIFIKIIIHIFHLLHYASYFFSMTRMFSHILISLFLLIRKYVLHQQLYQPIFPSSFYRLCVPWLYHT